LNSETDTGVLISP